MRRMIWIALVVSLMAFAPSWAEEHEEEPGCTETCADRQKKCLAGCEHSDDADDCVEACREASEECIDECD